ETPGRVAAVIGLATNRPSALYALVCSQVVHERHVWTVTDGSPSGVHPQRPESTDSSGDALRFDSGRVAPAGEGETLYTGTTDEGTDFVLLAQSALPVVSGPSAPPDEPPALEAAQTAPGPTPALGSERRSTLRHEDLRCEEVSVVTHILHGGLR